MAIEDGVVLTVPVMQQLLAYLEQRPLVEVRDLYNSLLEAPAVTVETKVKPKSSLNGKKPKNTDDVNKATNTAGPAKE